MLGSQLNPFYADSIHICSHPRPPPTTLQSLPSTDNNSSPRQLLPSPSCSWTRFPISTIFLPPLTTFQPAFEPGFRRWLHSHLRWRFSSSQSNSVSFAYHVWPTRLRLPGRHAPARQSTGDGPSLRSNVDLSPVNQGLHKPGRWLSYFYNRCVHFDVSSYIYDLPDSLGLNYQLHRLQLPPSTPATPSAYTVPIQFPTPLWNSIRDPTPS